MKVNNISFKQVKKSEQRVSVYCSLLASLNNKDEEEKKDTALTSAVLLYARGELLKASKKKHLKPGKEEEVYSFARGLAARIKDDVLEYLETNALPDEGIDEIKDLCKRGADLELEYAKWMVSELTGIDQEFFDVLPNHPLTDLIKD